MAINVYTCRKNDHAKRPHTPTAASRRQARGAGHKKMRCDALAMRQVSDISTDAKSKKVRVSDISAYVMLKKKDFSNMAMEVGTFFNMRLLSS